METIRQYISDVRNAFKLISTDDSIPDRFIASELIKANLKLVNQSLNKRVGWTSSNLFTTLPCIEMVEVPLIECCDVDIMCTIARSKDPLPAIADSKYSVVVQGVWSIDKKVKYKETTPNRYSNGQKLAIKNNNEKYFWILNNYLYISDPMIRKAAISAFFPNPVEALQYSCEVPEQFCPSNPLDLEFKTLPFLKDDIVKMVCERLLQTYKRSKPDQDSDNKEQYV